MTLKLYRSQVPEGFEEAVEAHRQALLSHRFTVDVPAPIAPSTLVEAAISRVQYPVKDKKPDDFVVDYVVEDDPPPPPKSFQDKKFTLMNEVLAAERTLSQQILPAGKARLFHIRTNDILMAKQTAELAKQPDPTTPEDEKFLSLQKERIARLDELNRGVAQALSDIEDLNEQTIDGWQMPAVLQVVSSAPAELVKGE
jgi:hypothetical protein